MLAGGTGVTVVKVNTMGPAVVVVGIFVRGPGRGRSAILAATAGAIGLPRLLDDGVLDYVNQRLGINGAGRERLGINGDGLGGGGVMNRGRTVLQVVCSEGRHLLL